MSYIAVTPTNNIDETSYVKKSSIDLVRKATEHEPGNTILQIRGDLYFAIEENIDYIMGIINDE
jgi:hypothetical protein